MPGRTGNGPGRAGLPGPSLVGPTPMSVITICMRLTKSMDEQALSVYDVLNDECLERMVEYYEAFKFLICTKSDTVVDIL